MCVSSFIRFMFMFGTRAAECVWSVLNSKPESSELDQQCYRVRSFLGKGEASLDIASLALCIDTNGNINGR